MLNLYSVEVGSSSDVVGYPKTRNPRGTNPTLWYPTRILVIFVPKTRKSGGKPDFFDTRAQTEPEKHYPNPSFATRLHH